MNTLSIGDIHGETFWEKIPPIFFNKPHHYEEYDKIIFTGDYVDSYEISNNDILQNFINIIEFKKKYYDKVILLLGNHDITYLLADNSRVMCSGHRSSMYPVLHQLFLQNKYLFQYAFQIENYIWTHAGIHKGWFANNFRNRNQLETIAGTLNNAFEQLNSCLFDCGYTRGGDKQVGGPLWADKNETYKKMLNGYHQIVGHTHIKDIQVFTNPKHNSSITYIDCYREDKPINEVFYQLII